MTSGDQYPGFERPDRQSALVVRLQSALLMETILPVLRSIHTDTPFVAGGYNQQIVWGPKQTAEHAALTPGWFYVPNVMLRRYDDSSPGAYVLWKEKVRPLVVLEFAADDGSQARDTTPEQGKYWLYEQKVRARFYGIYQMEQGAIELYCLTDAGYVPVAANEAGRFPIADLGVSLGIWQGYYRNMRWPWLRWWDLGNEILVTPQERAEQERRLVEQEQRRTERLAALLRSLSQGVDHEG
jgi:hypothetical protein